LTYRPTGWRPSQRQIVAAIVVVILGATLLPSRTDVRRPFAFCLMCDFRWLADAVLNVALFLPLGLVAGWRAKSPWKVALAGALFSTAIELLQIAVPGRDPELRDILSNSAGAALGAALVYRPRAWLFPGERRSTWLVGIVSVAVCGVIVGTSLLLAPARPQEPIHVSRHESDAVVRYQPVADGIGLDQPAYYVRNMFAEEPIGPARIDVTRRSTSWCLRFGAIERCHVGPTMGRGWSVLIYPAAIAHRWADELIDVLWTAALFFPLGFWTPRRRWVLSAAALIVLLAVVPSVVGLVPTTVGEWIGACAGAMAGVAFAEALRRRYVPRIRTIQQARR
jgi:hypothetical protein